MNHVQCKNLHRFGSEFDHDELSFELACSRLRRAAHRALAGFRHESRRREVKTTGVQCDLQPEQNITNTEEQAEEDSTAENPTSTGHLSISGNVLLASDWDLADDDIRFAYYPLLNLKCCGAHEQRNRRPNNSSTVCRSNLRNVGQNRTQAQCQRIPKFREAFPQRPSHVNPEATEEVQNRVRQTYDHAHSLPLHKSDNYLYQHTKRAKMLSQERPFRANRKVTARTHLHAERAETLPHIEGRPLAVHCPVCVCPRVASPPAVIPVEGRVVHVPPLVVCSPQSATRFHHCKRSCCVTSPLPAQRLPVMGTQCCHDQNIKGTLEACGKGPQIEGEKSGSHTNACIPSAAFSLPLPPSTATNICF